MPTLALFDQGTGKQVTSKESTRYEVVALGLPDTPGGLVFDSTDAFDAWGKKSPYAKMLAQHRQRVQQLQALDEVGRAEHLAHRTEVQRSVQSELAELAVSTGLPMDSENLVRV